MAPRALAAVAVWTAALAGQAAGQAPLAPGGPPPPAGFARVGEPAPLAPASMAPGNPYFAGGPAMMPMIDPVGMPPPGGAPVGPPPGYAGPPLPTDDLAYPGGPRGPQCWVGVDYLLYWTRHAPLPIPIATVGPAAGFGIIGTPGVQTILGSDEFNFHTFSGVRVSGGWWITENQTAGLEASLFVLPKKILDSPTIVGTDILPTLARPFVDTAQNRQNSRLLTRPNTFAGGIRAEATQTLWGADVEAVWRCFDRGGLMTIDYLSGFRFLSLEESLVIDDFAAALANGVVDFNGQQFRQPAVTFLQDRFSTTNRFYGWTSGFRVNANYEAITLGVTGKLGLGNMRQQIRVDGSTGFIGGANPNLQTTGGAFYATGANSGKFNHDEFSVLPELAMNLSVQVTRCLTLNLGYSYLSVTKVVRPGDQLSPFVNSTLIPTGQNFGAHFGPQTPGLPFATSTYWAQGFNFGFAVGY
jgi:hypothetical protein